MRSILIAFGLLVGIAAAQEATPITYNEFSVILAPPQQGDVVVLMATRDQKLIFTPVPDIAKAENDGAVPIKLGDIVQLLNKYASENERLKTENERLWQIAGNKTPTPSATVVVQTQPSPPPDPRQEMRQMLLRSFLAPKPVPVNVYHYDCSTYPALCVGHPQ